MRALIPVLFLVVPMCGAARLVAQMPEGVVRDPAAARLVYDDVDRFAAAHARLDGVADTLALLDSVYLDGATPGLLVYGSMYGLDAAALLGALLREPERYASAAAAGPAAVRRLEPAVRGMMEQLRSLYPAALFPPVYYLVGPQRAGGAVQREGVFIAVETYALAAGDRPTDALPELVHLVAHELVHYQQAAWNPELYQSSNTLLARAIKEGVADFIAELVSGRHINAAAHAYGMEHERELWRRFRREMHGTATGEWFFATPQDPAMPRDLGYFIGYRIARARFLREADAAAGIAALLRIADYEAFLSDSGYAESGSR
jgi:hypothetical protein